MNQEKNLHPHVIPYWKTKKTIWSFFRIALSFIPAGIHWLWLNNWNWLLYLTFGLVTVIALNGIFFSVRGVGIRYSRRSYYLTDDEIIIRSGNIWSDFSTVIPMTRIQHVDKEQGIIAKRYGLSKLVLHTAGEAHGIVGLLDQEAETLRRQVIEFAKLGDNDAYND